jgi:hypothetical protein
MAKKKTLSVLILIMILFAVGCSKESGEPDSNGDAAGSSCEGIDAKFNSDVLPLIQTKCATGGGCHGAGSTNGPGALTSFNQIENAAGSIKTAVLTGRMPLGGTLTNAQIRQISCWVNNGTPNN